MKINYYNDYEKDKKTKFNKMDRQKRSRKASATSLVDEAVQKEQNVLNTAIAKRQVISSDLINHDGIEQMPIEQEATNIPKENSFESLQHPEEEIKQPGEPAMPADVQVQNSSNLNITLRQRLSEEDLKKFADKPLVTDEEVAKGKCNHIKDGDIYTRNNGHDDICKICGKHFHRSESFNEVQIANAQSVINDVIETLKIFGNYNDKDYEDLVRTSIVVSKLKDEYFKGGNK